MQARSGYRNKLIDPAAENKKSQRVDIGDSIG